jgi:hypothetical protein
LLGHRVDARYRGVTGYLKQLHAAQPAVRTARHRCRCTCGVVRSPIPWPAYDAAARGCNVGRLLAVPVRVDLGHLANAPHGRRAD